MLLKALALIPAVIALSVAPVLAKPVVIAELGSAPLLGTSTSTAEMRARVARNEGVMSAAAERIGLTSSQYAQFHAAIAGSHVAWVTVPRHLDAMTWQGGGRVYVLHDVIIPKNTHGWEVDVPAHGATLALFMPAKCGNLSLLRKPARLIARSRPAPVHVAVVPPVPVAPPPAVVAEAPPPPPDDSQPAPVAAAPMAAEFPPAPVAASHHNALFLAPLLAGIAALAAGSGSGPIAAPPSGCP